MLVSLSLRRIAAKNTSFKVPVFFCIGKSDELDANVTSIVKDCLCTFSKRIESEKCEKNSNKKLSPRASICEDLGHTSSLLASFARNYLTFSLVPRFRELFFDTESV